MLALVFIMILCVALGVGVVGYVLVDARRQGRAAFWTPEGEELIAGARRTGEKVRERGEQIGRTAAERTRGLRARLPERAAGPDAVAEATAGAAGSANGSPQAGRPGGSRVVRDKVYEGPGEDGDPDFRAAS